MQKNCNKIIVALECEKKTIASTTKFYVATLVAKTKGDNLWLIDSNATKHMAFDPQTFCHLYEFFFFKIVYLVTNYVVIMQMLYKSLQNTSLIIQICFQQKIII